uniref:Uncharacterized protein n=1 Tax=Taeniopygia guttata TaxID=59729 RepID=A0A674GFB1_TAEGU
SVCLLVPEPLGQTHFMFAGGAGCTLYLSLEVCSPASLTFDPAWARRNAHERDVSCRQRSWKPAGLRIVGSRSEGTGLQE